MRARVYQRPQSTHLSLLRSRLAVGFFAIITIFFLSFFPVCRRILCTYYRKIPYVPYLFPNTRMYTPIHTAQHIPKYLLRTYLIRAYTYRYLLSTYSYIEMFDHYVRLTNIISLLLRLGVNYGTLEL